MLAFSLHQDHQRSEKQTSKMPGFFFLSVAVYDRMRADQKKFGKAAWAAAVERMEKLQYAVSKETLQLMRAKEICLEQKKHALKEEVSFHASK